MTKHTMLLAASVAFVAQTVGAQGLPNEITARQGADERLQRSIDAEAATRAAADANLQSNIAGEVASRTRAIDELRALIGSGGGGGTVNVDCGAGGSVADALASGAARIIVRGICPAGVLIDRDNVVVEADPAGGSIHGTDPNINTVVVTGHRVTLEGLTVSGGRNGITGVGASNLTVRNVTVQAVGRAGIVYAAGSSGTVDGCTVQSNAGNGVVVDGSNARIINSSITGNRIGVLMSNGSNGTIGLTDRGVPAGNTIQQNTVNGIFISVGASATVAMNQVMQNAQGIGVFHATASIAGGNVITGNPGGGIVATSAKVVLGDPGPGVTTVNTISQNGSPTQTGGVFAGVGTSMLVRDAQINSNNGTGLIISLRSQIQMSRTTIQSNAGDAVRLVLGAALLPLGPVSTLSGNSGFGVQCTDAESSVVNLVPTIVALSGNSAGNIASGCTQFDANPLFPTPGPNPAPAPGPVQ